MNLKSAYHLLLLVGVLGSCKNSAVDAAPGLEAVFVVKESIGCRQPLVKFTMGIEQACQVAGVAETYDSYFGVSNLDQSYWVSGKKLKLTIRKATTSTVCDAMGSYSPLVEAVDVE